MDVHLPNMETDAVGIFNGTCVYIRTYVEAACSFATFAGSCAPDTAVYLQHDRDFRCLQCTYIMWYGNIKVWFIAPFDATTLRTLVKWPRSCISSVTILCNLCDDPLPYHAHILPLLICAVSPTCWFAGAAGGPALLRGEGWSWKWNHLLQGRCQENH